MAVELEVVSSVLDRRDRDWCAGRSRRWESSKLGGWCCVLRKGKRGHAAVYVRVATLNMCRVVVAVEDLKGAIGMQDACLESSQSII